MDTQNEKHAEEQKLEESLLLRGLVYFVFKRTPAMKRERFVAKANNDAQKQGKKRRQGARTGRG